MHLCDLLLWDNSLFPSHMIRGLDGLDDLRSGGRPLCSGGHIPAPGFVEQLSPPLCQTLELGLNLLSVQSVGCGGDPLPLSADHLHCWPAVI